MATATFPVKDAAGKRVRFSGNIRAEGVPCGWAGLWWRVDGASGVLAFDNMRNRGATGMTDWRGYEVGLPVAAAATNVNFGGISVRRLGALFSVLSAESRRAAGQAQKTEWQGEAA